MNNVILSGRLVKDISPFYTDSGLCISHFTVAVQRPVRRRRTKEDSEASTSEENTQKETVDYINCVSFGKQAEMIANFIHKGKRIFLQGRLQVSSYTNKEGQRVWSSEVIVSSFEYVEPKDADGETVNSGNFGDFGVEDIEF